MNLDLEPHIDSQEIWDPRKYPEQLKKLSNDIFLTLHIELKGLQEFMNDLIGNEGNYDMINILGIFDFYKQYIQLLPNTFVDFEDYVLSFIQDKTEFAAKQLLERIWNEGNNVLNLYYENKSIFDKFDDKGFANTAVQTAFYSNYREIMYKLKKAMPKTLSDFYYENQPIIDLPITDIELMIARYRKNLIEVQGALNREVKDLDELIEMIDNTKCTTCVFSHCMEELTNYVNTIGTFIGKDSYLVGVIGSCDSTSEEIQPVVIEGELLDDLYELCNSTVVYSCSKIYFQKVINGERPDRSNNFRSKDICQLNRSYYLIHMMSEIIPYRQYLQWRDKLFEAQHIRKDVYNKKWTAVQQKEHKKDVGEFLRKVQQLVDKHRIA